jgi:hypothetical protein
MNPAAQEEEQAPGFWNRPLFLLALVIISTVPLLWPDVPPLADLPGHMGRYKIQLDLQNSPYLARFYDFEWALIGNLGIDLLAMPFAKLFGLELGVKLIVIGIPAMTVAAFLWLAQEVHGRVPPTSLFALPFAYAHPFMFGFVNFALSMAFAFLALALWLRLGRMDRLRLRAASFVPISLSVWLAHAFGWGTLCVMIFCAEAARQRDRGKPLLGAGIGSAFQCLALAPPLLLMLFWRSGGDVQGGTGGWFDWSFKLIWMLMALRDRWQLFDTLSLAAAALLIAAAIRSRRLAFSPGLAASALALLLVYILLPTIIFGSGYADMRLAPYLFALALIAIRPLPSAKLPHLRALAAAGLIFFLVRIGGHTASFWLYDRDYDRALAALDHVPRGAAMVSLVSEPCGYPWTMSRLQHLPGMAIVRREAFSNEQWIVAGAQLARVDFPAAGAFKHNPSQIVTRLPCPGTPHPPLSEALARLPWTAFDYVWLITPPKLEPTVTAGLRPIWGNDTAMLYRVEPRAQERIATSETPAGSGTRPTR